ncbi:MAG TPA: hypothetical protein VNF00_04705 [Candidatus Acidoferrales bacterium]|nr:hypothetical protein [Candidatus Acidoferrales bacterium]
MLSAPSMFNAPSVSSAAAPPDNYIQPTLGHGLRIWWAYYWPTNLIAAVLMFCFRFWLRKLYENVILSARTVVIAMRILPYATTYFVAFFIIWYVLGETIPPFPYRAASRDGRRRCSTAPADIQAHASRLVGVFMAVGSVFSNRLDRCDFAPGLVCDAVPAGADF